MSSLKIILRKKATKDGSYPLAIRIIKDRTSSYAFIGHTIDEKYWER